MGPDTGINACAGEARLLAEKKHWKNSPLRDIKLVLPANEEAASGVLRSPLPA